MFFESASLTDKTPGCMSNVCKNFGKLGLSPRRSCVHSIGTALRSRERVPNLVDMDRLRMRKLFRVVKSRWNPLEPGPKLMDLQMCALLAKTLVANASRLCVKLPSAWGRATLLSSVLCADERKMVLKALQCPAIQCRKPKPSPALVCKWKPST